jgi:hypothetical protein
VLITNSPEKKMLSFPPRKDKKMMITATQSAAVLVLRFPCFTRTEYMRVQILQRRSGGVQLGTQEGSMPIGPLYFGPLYFHPQAGRVGIHASFFFKSDMLVDNPARAVEKQLKYFVET